MKRCQSFQFPIRSWVDLPLFCNPSFWMAFHFRDCQTFFCLLLTLSTLISSIFLIPGTFHPKRWPLSSPLCPASKNFPLNSNPLNLALIWKAQVCLHQTDLSSPLSTGLNSKALLNI